MHPSTGDAEGDLMQKANSAPHTFFLSFLPSAVTVLTLRGFLSSRLQEEPSASRALWCSGSPFVLFATPGKEVELGPPLTFIPDPCVHRLPCP